MADIYVKKTGNDSSGNGSNGSPYLTITKAVSVVNNSDRIIIGAGTYTENNIGSAVTKTNVRICDLGDGMVIISGSDGTADASTGNVIRAYNGWIIDGSTGSNLQNIEILGGNRSCVSSKSGTKNFSVKNCILTGRGDRRDNLTANATQFAIYNAGGNEVTIRNCVMRNFLYGFNQAASNSGATKFHNNICYSAGYSGSTYAGLYNNYSAGTEAFYNTITDFTGGYAISMPANGTKVKNNLCAFIDVSLAGIYADDESGGAGNFRSNNVYIKSGETTPKHGSYRDYSSTAIDSSNKELQPMFKLRSDESKNPWREYFNSQVNGDFSLKPTVYHYEGSSRSAIGTELAEAGENLSSTITADFSGSSRSSTPTIGALETSTQYLYSKTPTGDGLEDAVLKDFTINHYNRLSKEVPRSTDQIPFGKLVKSTANLKDRAEAYKLTKESK